MRSDAAEEQLVEAVGRVALGLDTPAEAAATFGLDVGRLVPYAPAGRAAAVELSVVIAAYDEGGTLEDLWRRLAPVLDRFASSEVVIVDDGSTDSTWEVIGSLAEQDQRVRGIRLSRNFGQQAALTVALEAAVGDAVACIDADLQDPPELLPEMVQRLRAGADVVYAVRRRREAGAVKRAAYRWFYRLYRAMAEIEVPLDSGDFAVLDRRVVDQLVELPERTRFLRGLRSWVGFRQEAFEYDRPDRASGVPKYTFRKLLRLALDGLVSLSSLPLRLASVLGFVTALAGLAYIGVALVTKVVSDDVPAGWTSLIAIILVLGGAQLTVIGVLGEYVARVYQEVKRRPHAVVRERVGAPGGR